MSIKTHKLLSLIYRSCTALFDLRYIKFMKTTKSYVPGDLPLKLGRYALFIVSLRRSNNNTESVPVPEKGHQVNCDLMMIID